MNPKISVVVPVFNSELHLQKCIDSICKQTYVNLEIIIVNDGSTDNSSVISDDLANKDNRIKVIHKKNEGVSVARNIGVELATGEYIGFVDSDDWLEQDAYEKIVDIIIEQRVEAVIFEYKIVHEDGNYKHNYYKKLNGFMTNEKAIESVISPVSRFIWNKVFSKRLLKDIEFDSTLFYGEDTLYAIQALSKAQLIFYLSEPLYNYFQSPSSVTRSEFNSKIFTGVTAFRKQMDFCKIKYPTLVEVAQIALKNIIVNVLVMIIENDRDKEYQVLFKKLHSEFKLNFFKIIKSTKISKRLKIKFVMAYLNPSLIIFTKSR
jgi:glycosyltransferase involved in cell wall biosynthesis